MPFRFSDQMPLGIFGMPNLRRDFSPRNYWSIAKLSG